MGSNDEKVSNYKLAKAVGLKVGSRTTDEAYDKAYEHRKISVAVTRKKKTAIDAISNVVEGKFDLTKGARNDTFIRRGNRQQ